VVAVRSWWWRDGSAGVWPFVDGSRAVSTGVDAPEEPSLEPEVCVRPGDRAVEAGVRGRAGTLQVEPAQV